MGPNRNVPAALRRTHGGFSGRQSLRRRAFFVVFIAVCLLVYSYFKLLKIEKTDELGTETNFEVSSFPVLSPQRKLLQVQKPISDESLGGADVEHSQINRLAIREYVEGMLFNHLNWNRTSAADSFLFSCHYNATEGVRLLTKNSKGVVCSSTYNSVVSPQSNDLIPATGQLFDSSTDGLDDTTSRSSGAVNETRFQSSLSNFIWFCSITEDSELSHGLQYSCIIPQTKDRLAAS